MNKTDRDLGNKKLAVFIILLYGVQRNEKTKQNNKTVILDKLKELIMSEEVDSKDVEDLPKKVDNPDDAAKLINKIEQIMKSKKNNILMLAYHQGIIFKKYKENNKFMSAVANFKISKTTINFQIY